MVLRRLVRFPLPGRSFAPFGLTKPRARSHLIVCEIVEDLTAELTARGGTCSSLVPPNRLGDRRCHHRLRFGLGRLSDPWRRGSRVVIVSIRCNVVWIADRDPFFSCAAQGA